MVRTKKKQKRLDAIKDNLSVSCPSSSTIRRSSRDRRAPVVLDSSPVPSPRKKRPRLDSSPVSSSSSGSNNKRKREVLKSRKVISLEFNDPDSEAWGNRLRERAKGKAKMKERKKKKSKFRARRKYPLVETESPSTIANQLFISESGGEDASPNEKSVSGIQNLENDELSHNNNSSQSELKEDKINEKNESLLSKDSEPLQSKDGNQYEVSGSNDQIENALEEEPSPVPPQQTDPPSPVPPQQTESTSPVDPPQTESPSPVAPQQTEPPSPVHPQQTKSPSPVPPDQTEPPSSPVPSENINQKANDRTTKPSEIKEGRICGLCRGGTHGKPPKILVNDMNDSDKETHEGGVMASDESNYDVWDGFADEPGWLGRLLGPIRDRIGISRIWVHQNCAVWSPEVYFAGPGYLKSIRAALYRGKSLKCTRCSRPGATIGCRVDRCPKTYHLPCSRAVGCIFDHRKFLIACNDHRHLFQPHGAEYSLHLKKLKLKKLRADLKKRSNDSRRKDMDAEEKFLENCGEDEEFLKRETKRLHRDVLRIAPSFIGGVCENNPNYEGWESIAGLKDVINCMKEVVILPLLYPEIFDSLNLTPPRGVLLHGHPGTGKTLIVRALIGACSKGEKKIAYFHRKGADCLGKYVGDAERQLRLLFQVAEKSQPSIIFFDEIDGLAPSRSKRQDQTHNSVVATLLSLMDGLKSRGSVIVIGATNRPDAVDPALRRPGRFDREIYFPLPSKEDRLSILALHTSKWPNRSRNLRESIISFVAEQTIGYSGADLQSICTQTVVNALKRSFPLKEILLKAEIGGFGKGIPKLPGVSVEERDWIEALMSAPPPCARRFAGSVISDVLASPLDSCLVPCLLKPLCRFLVSVGIDERVWLPHALLKAAIIVKNIIFSELQKKNISIKLWSSYIYSMIEKEERVKDELIKMLSKFGLLSSRIGSKEVFDGNNNEETEVLRCKKYGGSMSNNLLGFRVLISGPHRSGQQGLSSCLLHGFLGEIEVIKVNLATMSLQGNGDIISGLTQILSKCVNLGRCIIFMPRIDLWAVDKAQKRGPTRNDDDDVSGDVGRVSEIWSMLVEQVNSARTSSSVIILATSEAQFDDLPVAIRTFFSPNSSNSHSIPRFSLDLDGKFNANELVNLYASKLSHDLMQHYIQLVHQTSHNSSSNNTNSDIQTQFQIQNTAETEIETEKEIPNSTPVVEIPKNAMTKSNHNNAITGAISSFGYQILIYPQFSLLCWVTSELKEGPCTDTKGPWKGWPFNSCIVRPAGTIGTSSGTGTIGTSSGTGTSSQGGIVFGLVAVGLLAYRGVYASINQVCFEVRRVLELLAKKIEIRVLEKRDPYRYFKILTQVAYLEDMVLNWAYSLQRMYGDIRMGEPIVKSTIHENTRIENRDKDDEPPNESQGNNPNEVQDNNPNEAQDNNPNETQDNNPNEVENNLLNEVEDNNPNIHEANDTTILENSQNRTLENEVTEPVPAETQELLAGTSIAGTDTGTAATGGETMFLSRDIDSCSYTCCYQCFRGFHGMVYEAMSKFWETRVNCSEIDDMHDIITRYALNIISRITKKYASQSDSENVELVLRECELHVMNNGKNGEENLSFLFRDGVLMPLNIGLNGDGEEKIHCNFVRLCLTPILDLVTF